MARTVLAWIDLIFCAVVLFFVLTMVVGTAALRSRRLENDKLVADVASLAVENTRLKSRIEHLEQMVKPQPMPTSLPENCPAHSEMGQEQDGSWQIICIDPWIEYKDYGVKSISIRRSVPEVSGGWQQREELLIRATITDPPLDPKVPSPLPSPWSSR